jgi:hypothetical protein
MYVNRQTVTVTTDGSGPPRPLPRSSPAASSASSTSRTARSPTPRPWISRSRARRRGRRSCPRRTCRPSTTWAPRQPTHTTAGAASLYAAGGTAVNDHICLANERVKIVLAQGGSAKAGVFHVTSPKTDPARFAAAPDPSTTPWTPSRHGLPAVRAARHVRAVRRTRRPGRGEKPPPGRRRRRGRAGVGLARDGPPVRLRRDGAGRRRDDVSDDDGPLPVHPGRRLSVDPVAPARRRGRDHRAPGAAAVRVVDRLRRHRRGDPDPAGVELPGDGDAEPGRITPAYGLFWPSTRVQTARSRSRSPPAT